MIAPFLRFQISIAWQRAVSLLSETTSARCWWNIEVPFQIVQTFLNLGELDGHAVEPFRVLNFGQEALDDLSRILNQPNVASGRFELSLHRERVTPSECRSAELQLRIQALALVRLDIRDCLYELHEKTSMRRR
jgi:hypothetical protein